MKTFNEWVNQLNPKTLSIYDLDDTLALTPKKPLPHEDHKGWNKKDWWGSKESLSHPKDGGFFDGKFNDVVLSNFIKDKNNPNVKTIILTGRRSVVAPYVRKTLRDKSLFGKRVIDPLKTKEIEKHQQNLANNLDVDHPRENGKDAHEEYYSGDHTVSNKLGGTLGHKIEIMNKLAREGKYETIILWDDRYVPEFKEFAKQLKAEGVVKNFIIHEIIHGENGEIKIVDWEA